MPQHTEKATRREWIGLVALALPCLLYTMDLTVLNLAVPHLVADLKPSAVQLLWIVDIYGFLIAGSLITMGTLGDRIGRRKVLLAGAVLFGIASVIAAFSTSAEMLIAARALLGIAGATLAPSTLSLIRNMFHDAGERTFAISIWATSYSVGAAIGPLLGGVLLEYFWWGSVFLLAVPVMVLLLIVGPILLPEYRDPNAGRLDVTSAALSLVAVLAMVYGLKQIASDGAAWLPIAAILAGLAVGAAFVVRQRRLADPLLDLGLFRSRPFSAALIVNVIACFVAFGPFVFIAQYLQLVIGLTPLKAGLWTLPSSVGFVISSMMTSWIVARVPAPRVIAAGLALAALAFLLLTQVGNGHPLAMIVTATIVMSLGLGLVFTLTTDLIVGAAPPERAGAAGALSETGAEFGGVLGIAVLGSIGMAIYRGAMASGVPAGVPEEAAHTARDTLGGAVAVAPQLPNGLADAMLVVARDAFTNGFELIATISTVLTLVAAVVMLLVFRKGGPTNPSDEPQSAAMQKAA